VSEVEECTLGRWYTNMLQLKSLQSLTLKSRSAHAYQAEEGVGGILAQLVGNHSSLTSLSLNNIVLADERDIFSLSSNLSKSENIKSICLKAAQSLLLPHLRVQKGSKFSPVGPLTLLQYDLPPLLTLKLPKNYIQDEGISGYLGKFLEKNTQLTHLDLSQNSISSSGLTLLGKALSHNTSLKKLVLTNNDFDDRGALSLVTSLQKAKNLAYLDLGDKPTLWARGDKFDNNRISDWANRVIVGKLKFHSSLSQLRTHKTFFDPCLEFQQDRFRIQLTEAFYSFERPIVYGIIGNVLSFLLVYFYCSWEENL
jgi:Ran GTPase-activating protein (RanGAP) involved in mRNA processing and transport